MFWTSFHDKNTLLHLTFMWFIYQIFVYFKSLIQLYSQNNVDCTLMFWFYIINKFLSDLKIKGTVSDYDICETKSRNLLASNCVFLHLPFIRLLFLLLIGITLSSHSFKVVISKSKNKNIGTLQIDVSKKYHALLAHIL